MLGCDKSGKRASLEALGTEQGGVRNWGGIGKSAGRLVT